MAQCIKNGCDRDGKHRGYCHSHYKTAITRREILPIHPKGLSLSEKLERYSKVDPETGCVEWTRYRNQDGYGQVNIGHRMMGAHRVSWEIKHGPIPEDLQVLHKCDNPSCINPEHLFLGTQTENIADMNAKGRQVPSRGARNGRAKLTDDQVREIRSDPRFQKEIAVDYGVNQTLVSMIKRRVAWSHIA